MTLSITTLSIMTLSITALSLILCVIMKNVTLCVATFNRTSLITLAYRIMAQNIIEIKMPQ